MSDKLLNQAKALAARMRKTGKYSTYQVYSVLQDVYTAGYKEGHDDQMRARILDAMEKAKP